MTEEEAKTKWCPFARVFIPLQDKKSKQWAGVTAANRVCLSSAVETINPDDERSSPLSARCISSACMAWRWRRHGPVLKLETGYCGLAGKP